MKTIRNLIVLGAFAALSVAASAQSLGGGSGGGTRPIYVAVNQLTNGGFESSPLNWSTSGSHIYDFETGVTTSTTLGFRTNLDSYAGSYAYDFGTQNATPYDIEKVSYLSQWLATPLAGSSVYSASVWVKSTGQYLTIEIKYTDSTASYSTNYFNWGAQIPNPGNNYGWQKWDLKPIVNTSKTISKITFQVFSSANSTPNDLLIDNASFTKLVPF